MQCAALFLPKVKILTFGFVLMTMVTPLLTLILMIQIAPKCFLPNTDRKFGTLYQGLRLDNYKGLKTYSAIFQLRRFVFGFLSAYFLTHAFFQTSTFVLSMQFYLIYLCLVKPQENNFENALEVFNETVSMLMAYHLLLFTDLLVSYGNQPAGQYEDSETIIKQRVAIGRSFCIFTAILLATNFSLILRTTLNKAVIWPAKKKINLIRFKRKQAQIRRKYADLNRIKAEKFLVNPRKAASGLLIDELFEHEEQEEEVYDNEKHGNGKIVHKQKSRNSRGRQQTSQMTTNQNLMSEQNQDDFIQIKTKKTKLSRN